ncbi:hypothetical protein [Tateyamaria sp.]|uniref:hypothetical protein n=1 Tax=Tateyamaria sp. TaxID=1929288 RepID=UPI0039B93EED
MERMWGLLACVGLCVQAAFAWGEALPMVQRVSLLTDRAPLFPLQEARPGTSASLFNGVEGKSLFASMPVTVHVSVAPLQRDGPVAQLRTLIAQAEAGSKGYDAVQYGARIKPSGEPTTLTIREVYQWIDDTPGQPHAIGRYQFIPPTLRRLVSSLGVSLDARFTPRVQDQLADVLLQEAGLRRFRSGEMERQAFMNNLAKIWAGLPNDTGKSHYHGYAGNKATMTWANFDAQMARIFPG